MGILCRGLFGVVFISLTMGSTGVFADQPQKSSSTRAITARINDLVINRGSAGLWTYRNGRTLQKIFSARGASMKKKTWMKPVFLDLRLGFEITMYAWTK